MENEEVSRGQWGTRVGFVLAAIGSAVGLGNIWRFPYMAYENGGGAFLIPYFFALLTAGIPLLIAEMGLGHKMRGSAPVSFRKIGKKFETLGWWPVLVAFMIMVYYSVVMAWALNYIVFAFTQAWGTETEAFFFNEFLNMKGFWNIGGFQIPVLFSLVVIWGLCYVIVYKGIETSIEKASKIFMPLLAILIVLITIRGVTLPGAVDGINNFLQPDFSALTDPSVWISAYGQVFFTLSLGFGIMINYASYLPKKSDVVNNAFITAFANSGFSFLAGIGVFSVLGYMAQAQGVALQDVATSGMGLAFVAFPKAINLLPGFRGLFGVLFFLSLAISGISSGISLIDAFSSSIRDKFDITRQKATSLVCGIGFVGSLIYATDMGLAVLDVIDHFMNSFGLVVVGLVECIVIGYLWKTTKLREHVNAVSDFKVGFWWDIAVKYITVIMLIATVGTNFITEISGAYGGYPWSAVLTLGWGSAVGVILVAYYLSTRKWEKELPTHSVEEE
jgi:NSS family neurotransmitter:Na+ symporter